jgi:GT2 family glycosyltransferase
MIKKIAVLLTCFNRKKLTLNCIQQLNKQVIRDFCLDIYLVDDGCTDGTYESVKTLYPKINIIAGDGSLYWNGGMRLAWQTALKNQYDFYLWVNDDSFIYPDAISNLVSSYYELVNSGKKVGAVLGSMVDPESKELTYGGRLKGGKLNPLKMGPIIVPSNLAIECDYINGNFTLIPQSTVDKIGILNSKFTHSMGDFDYGLRAKQQGLLCYVAPGIYGECTANSVKGSWQDNSLPLSERLKKMKRVNQLPPPNEWKYFIRNHGGPLGVLQYMLAVIRDKLPLIWLMISRKL